jgi:hypothetical protein
MDRTRFEQLKKKRFEEGLSDDEANELGRLFAEAEGEEYKSADEFQAEVMAEVMADEEPIDASTILAGEAPPDHEPGTEDRPETLKDEAESRQPPDEDEPGGARAPIGSRSEGVDEK